MRCLSLFSGGGGLDLGLETVGFQTIAFVEADRDACCTLELNMPGPVLCSRVEDLECDVFKGLGEVDLVAGGPPCQPFSKSALWTAQGARGFADTRSATIAEFFRVVRACGPKAFLLENVERFRSAGGLAQVQIHLDELARHGLRYTICWAVLNAAEFGVAQHRRRFVVWGYRDRAAPPLPAPTHGPGLIPYRSSWDALVNARSEPAEDLRARGRWAELLPSIPPGQNYLWHSNRGGGLPLFGWRTRYWSFLKKLDPDLPAPTIVANPSQNSGPFHWENRLLSIGEIARLQSFPPDYKFAGSRASQHRQIGNAVPPVLGAVLGSHILKALGGTPGSFEALEISTAPNASPQSSVQAVSPRYLSLVGVHPDHAGPGKGPSPRPDLMPLTEAA
jgi:DNA (cytosine-5)-methyltransferase 1